MDSEHTQRTVEFAKEVIDVLDSLNIKPVLWGSLAFQNYQTIENYVIKDIDLLIPEAKIAIVRKEVKQYSWQNTYDKEWNSLELINNSISVELDPIEAYQPITLGNKINIETKEIDIISKESLASCYLKAFQDKRVHELGPNKQEEYREKYFLLSK